MEHPGRYVGFINYHGTDYPFEFFEDSFKLNLYPFSKEDMVNRKFDGLLAMGNGRSDEWVPTIKLDAILSDRNHITFAVVDVPTHFNALMTFDVLWFYYYNADRPIKGISICGKEVDSYYPPSNAYDKISYLREDKTFKSLKVDVIPPKEESCGCFEMGDKSIAVSVSAIATMSPGSGIPLKSQSYLYAASNEDLSIDEMLHLQWSVISFLKYSCYRKNHSISQIDVFSYDQDGLRVYFGFLCFPNKSKKETNPRGMETTLKHFDLKESAARIIFDISSGLIPMQHICDSFESRKHYDAGRIIVLFSAFEREFHNIYGKEAGRSEEYVNVKDDIVKLLTDDLENYQGHRRDCYKEIIKIVKNINSSYGQKVKLAITDCSEVMKLLVSQKFHNPYESSVNDYCKRINDLRNGLTHNRLDFEIQPIHLTDLNLLEELMFVMRLKAAGLGQKEIIGSINNLFREYIPIS